MLRACSLDVPRLAFRDGTSRNWPTKRILRRTAKCRSHNGDTALTDPELDLLHNFWLARGVRDSAHRARLISHGCIDNEIGVGEGPEGFAETGLPGAHVLWHIDRDATQADLVRAVTVKLLDLHMLLGRRSDLDVASMLISCPGLLGLTSGEIIQRLIKMKSTEGAEALDIGKIIEAQPSLLLHSTSEKESPEAWRYGLLSSADENWLLHLKALEEYGKQHGHFHAGFSSEEDIDLSRFARMQRAAFQKGILAADRREVLEKLGFQLDANEAEWDLMYRKLEAAQKQAQGDTSFLDGSFDFLLNNWCSVQRISQRSGMLSSTRIQRLNDLNFDWTGADALS